VLAIFIELAIGIVTMRNPAINAKAVAHIFERKYHPKTLGTPELRTEMDKALTYLQQVEAEVLSSKDGPLRDRLKRTTEEMVDWVEGIYNLASRLDNYSRDEIIRNDLRSVPETIRKLRKQLVESDDPNVRRQIEGAIQDREDQLTSLQKLQSTMENARLLLDRNLSDMGRVYSQVVLMSSLKESAGKATDLQTDISEHVDQLQDLVDAMDEFHTDRRSTSLAVG
jgi:DNA repair ATPase RecN